VNGRQSQNRALHNNKMQLTRSGHSRWRPSQLILVLHRLQSIGHAAAGVTPLVACAKVLR
jgi:hypothetical protein